MLIESPARLEPARRRRPARLTAWRLLAPLFLVVGIGAARADTAVVPGAQAGQEGNSNGGILTTSPPPARQQQVYAATEFLPLGGPLLISQMAYRPDAQFGDRSGSYLYPSLHIELSTTGGAPDALSTVFAQNTGADAAVVFDGPLTLSTAFTGPAGGPKDFDIVIDFQSPFLYDPARGNLLVDIIKIGGGGLVPDRVDVLGDSVSFVFGGFPDDPTLTVGRLNTGGSVTRFTFTVIPEPGTLALFAGGLLPLAGAAIRKRRA